MTSRTASDTSPSSRPMSRVNGCALGVLDGRSTGAPEFWLVVSNTGRDLRLGWRLARGPQAREQGAFKVSRISLVGGWVPDRGDALTLRQS